MDEKAVRAFALKVMQFECTGAGSGPSTLLLGLKNERTLRAYIGVMRIDMSYFTDFLARLRLPNVDPHPKDAETALVCYIESVRRELARAKKVPEKMCNGVVYSPEYTECERKMLELTFVKYEENTGQPYPKELEDGALDFLSYVKAEAFKKVNRRS